MQNNKLEYKNYINCLFDIYGSLLTQKQQEYFKMYYFEDYSLREIASELEVSSNAVYDQIKNIEKILEKYEDNLHVYENNNKRSELLDKIEKSSDMNEIKKLVSELKSINEN